MSADTDTDAAAAARNARREAEAPTGVEQRPPADSKTFGKVDVRALTEWITLLPDYDRARGAPGLYMAVSHSGKEYLVDLFGRSCECADSRYRHRECKHVRRARYATGELSIPGWVDVDKIHRGLGRHIDVGEPMVRQPDGTDRALSEVRS